MESSDENFIYSSIIKNAWSKAFLFDKRYWNHTHAMPALEQIVQNIMQKSQCVLLVNRELLDEICGFIVFERKGRRACVYYCYVKEAFRGLGYGKLLWQFATNGTHQDDTVWCAFMTALGRNILDKHKVPFQWRPSAMFSRDTFESMEDNQYRYA
jgi:ribosomal protein S18 acetylase RimI-like enzyme